MAEFKSVLLKTELRPCYVMEKGTKEKALFHKWIESHEESGTVLYAVIELDDGTVNVTYARNIVFTDNKIFYVWREE